MKGGIPTILVVVVVVLKTTTIWKIVKEWVRGVSFKRIKCIIPATKWIGMGGNEGNEYS